MSQRLSLTTAFGQPVADNQDSLTAGPQKRNSQTHLKDPNAVWDFWSVFDPTKTWPHAQHPLIEVGELELNRNLANYFADVEQSAFSPANIVPGMGFSPDKMLQGRLFAYNDAHRYRIGTNYAQLPVNAPQCPYHNNQRDGAMRFDGNAGAAPKLIDNIAGSMGGSRARGSSSASWRTGGWSMRSSPPASRRG